MKPASLKKYDTDVQEAIELYMYSKDYATLQNECPKGETLSFNISRVEEKTERSEEIQLESGKDFFFRLADLHSDS